MTTEVDELLGDYERSMSTAEVAGIELRRRDHEGGEWPNLGLPRELSSILFQSGDIGLRRLTKPCPCG